MTITSLEPLELPMPEPEDDPADPYPEYGSRDEFERDQWFGERAQRPEPIFDKSLEDFYAIGDDGEIPF
jgi:AAA+ superfamily predicted ATPase